MVSGWKNRITGMLGSDYPIISGPMRLITLGSMAGAVSDAGGFGIIAASGLSRDDLIREIDAARSITDRPIGVNIPVYRPNAADMLDVSIDMGVRAVYTSAGNPAKVMERIKSSGVKVIHKVSNVDMAYKAQAAGVDAVVAMGYEAGGHIGREGITTFCLIPMLARSLKIPVIASGGISDARGLLAALALGAEGVEIGTRLVATRECPVPGFFKDALCQAALNSTVVLGKEAMPIRVLKNIITSQVSHMSDSETDRAMNTHGDALYVADGGDRDTAIMPCGQVAGLISEIAPVNDVLCGMIRETKAIVESLDAITSGGG